MFADARSFSSQTGLTIGAGASTTLTLGDGAFRPALTFLGAYHVPFSTDRDGVEIRASLASLRLVPSVALLRTRGLVLDFGAGGGIDILGISTGSLDPTTHLSPGATDVLPVASALLAARVSLGASAAALLALGGDVDLAPKRYVIALGDARDHALDPERVRVGVLAGFAFDLTGSEAQP
jgi:hypothetical protein